MLLSHDVLYTMLCLVHSLPDTLVQEEKALCTACMLAKAMLQPAGFNNDPVFLFCYTVSSANAATNACDNMSVRV